MSLAELFDAIFEVERTLQSVEERRPSCCVVCNELKIVKIRPLLATSDSGKLFTPTRRCPGAAARGVE